MAVDMFLKLTDCEGESKDDSHKNEIDVLAWSWGMSQSGTMHMGSGGGAGKVAVQDLSVTKYIDKATTILMQKVCKGDCYDEALLTVRKAGGEPLEYLIITMTNVIVSSYSTGGSGGEDRLTENISLNFEKVKVEYTPQEADGSGGASSELGWDIAANIPM